MSADRSLVSVITPAFRASETIRACLASVRAQRHISTEHIVVLDGPDLTSERLARVAGAQVIVQPQAGAAAARNSGITVARGEWLLFLDADDVIHPRHISRLLACARMLPGCSLAACGYQRDGADGKKIASYPPPTFDNFLRAQRPPGAIHAFLVRRELAARVGGFDDRLTTNEDWDFWLRVFEVAEDVATTSRTSARYQTTPGSLSHFGAAMIEDAAEVRRRSYRNLQQPSHQEAERRLETVLWNASLAIGAGRAEEGEALAERAHPLTGLPEDEALLCEAVIDGLVVGAGMAKPNLMSIWRRIDKPIASMLRVACSAASQPALAFALERLIARELARVGRLAQPEKIGSMLVRSLWLSDMISGVPATPFGGATLLKIPLLRPRRLCILEISQKGESGTAMLKLILTQFKDSLLSVLLGRRLTQGSTNAAARFVAHTRRAGARIRRKLLGLKPDVPPELPGIQPGEDTPGGGCKADWDAFFAHENPWSYESAYEQVKYRRTLDLLLSVGPGLDKARAIELACAEGMFTKMLATSVKSVLATDISAVAIERALKRCAGVDNVEFTTLDFFNADIGGPWDVIVCSEVMYYMDRPDALPGFADRVATALTPDGLFVHAHAYEVTDGPARTGFDWNDPLSAHTISRVFHAATDLECVAAVETDLYLIEVYRRRSSQASALPVVPEKLPLGAELDSKLAGWVVWNGAIKIRPILDETVRSSQVPVLMYHSVANEGPAALAQWRVSPQNFERQLRFLRRRGFRATYPEEWDYEARRHASLRGRPILITFDDGYADFHNAALPILERNGFSAHLFIVTGKVGGYADWDAGLGEPLPLMDWNALADCRKRGTSIGSHLHTHSAATYLSDQMLLEECTRSRDTLAERLAIEVTTVAPPFGVVDARVARICVEAGYQRLFTVEPGIASAWAQRMHTPRLEVTGDTGLAAFAEMLNIPEDEAPNKQDDLI